jgi:uridine kinase
MRLTEIGSAVRHIVDVRDAVSRRRAALVAVSGIDGCGKGYVTAEIAALLEGRGLRAAVLNVDGWLELPSTRFSAVDAPLHFYRHALRFDAMFETLVFPLRDTRAFRVDVDHAEETATAFRRRRYEYDDVDVVLLEGIYLLKRAFVRHYDLALWIECTFETALERAVARAQEGLSPAATIDAYERLYFPAQRIHFARDEPAASASLRLVNDPRLDSSRH